jgi:serine/threonine protein kinase
MAPEQFQRTATLDAQVDVYASGVVLYEMLTGRQPFRGTPLELAASAQGRTCPTPSQVEPSVWPALDPLVMTALAADPVARYRTGAEFAEALRRTWEAYSTPTSPQPGPQAGEAADASTGLAAPTKGSTDELPSIYQYPTPPELLGPEPWPIGLAASAPIAGSGARWPLFALVALLLIGVGTGTAVLLANGMGLRGQPAGGLGHQTPSDPHATQTAQVTQAPPSTSTATVARSPISPATTSTPGPSATPMPSATSGATPTATPTPSGIVTLSGTVSSVDFATSNFGCQISSGPNVTVVTTSQTQFSGRASQVSDLHQGERVTITGSYESDGTFLATQVQARH